MLKTNIIDIASYIAEDNPDAAEQFLTSTKETFDFLASMPLTGRIAPFRSHRVQNVRVCRVNNFERCLIFYRPLPHGIEIIRVLHTARNIEAILEDK